MSGVPNPWDAAGSVVGAAVDAWGIYEGSKSVDKTNEANERIARENREFQERMAGTAYQRSVNDMRAAGLNPAVMMQGGGGPASTPAGAVATMQNKAGLIGAGAQEMARIGKDFAEQTSRAYSNREAAKLDNVTQKLVQQQTNTALQQERLTSAEADIAEAEAVKATNEADMRRKWPRITAYADYLIGKLGAISGMGLGVGAAAAGMGSLKRARTMETWSRGGFGR